MPVDDAAVRDFGLDLEHLPNLTELRLPSRISCLAAFGLGFIGLLCVVFTMIAGLMAMDRRQSLIGPVIVSLIVVALLFVLYQAARAVRYGVKVTITPDHLIVRRHWANGGKCLELYLNQAQFEAGRRAIVIGKSLKQIKIGTGLKPEAQQAIVGFLNRVIAGHLHPDLEELPAVSRSVEQSPVGDALETWQTVANAGPLSFEPTESDTTELSILALCLRFRDCDRDKVHLAPDIPQEVLVNALQGYLDLQDDEVLLAIVGINKPGSPLVGCALTTKRVYWSGAGEKATGFRPSRRRSLDFSSIAETIGVAGVFSSLVDLGKKQRISLIINQPIRDALVAFLRASRSLARGETPRPDIKESERAVARRAWPRVVDADVQARALQTEIRAFDRHAQVVSRVIVTPAIVAICVGVFVAMVATGTSLVNPQAEKVIAWGADFGPSVVFEHQVWRLFTSMFVHLGFLHIFLNMFCLISAGAVVERFFGHFGFALLYVLSGMGGAIASLWVHPTAISAGASGAIFGIFGGLLGYLAIRHREVPAAVLKPLRTGALAFVGYNTLFSVSVPGIDTAAHLGGLATGLVCGLLMTTLAPARLRQGRGMALALRVSLIATVIAAALVGIGQKGIDYARGQILADPKMGPRINALLTAGPDWNAYSAAADPLFTEFDRIGNEIERLVSDLEKGGIPTATITQTLHRLKSESKALGARIPSIPARNVQIQEIRTHLASAQTYQLQMLTSIEQLVATGEQSDIEGPRGLSATSNAYIKEFQTIGSLRDAYFKAHRLQPLSNTP